MFYQLCCIFPVSVTSHFDCSAMTMQAAAEDFLNKVGGGRSKVCIVYLIGHTVQVTSGDKISLMWFICSNVMPVENVLKARIAQHSAVAHLVGGSNNDKHATASLFPRITAINVLLTLTSIETKEAENKNLSFYKEVNKQKLFRTIK